jgi:hypothetical protein
MATIEDPIPVGHVSLRIAFQRYHGRDHEPINDQDLIHRFQSHLESGELRAKIRDPHSGTEFGIPPEAWRGAQYGYRSFFYSTIYGNENQNDAFKPYAGRTPFVLETELSAILDPIRATRVAGSHTGGHRENTKRTRQKGAGVFAALDEPLVEKMRSLLTKRKGLSVNAAAHRVARQARETAAKKKSLPLHLCASVDSIAHRLAKRYRG